MSQHPSKKKSIDLIKILESRFFLILLLGSAGISLIRSTVGQGTDFLVFWKVGRALWVGNPFYDLTSSAGMVFKSPPWIAPFFLPFINQFVG